MMDVPIFWLYEVRISDGQLLIGCGILDVELIYMIFRRKLRTVNKNDKCRWDGCRQKALNEF